MAWHLIEQKDCGGGDTPQYPLFDKDQPFCSQDVEFEWDAEKSLYHYNLSVYYGSRSHDHLGGDGAYNPKNDVCIPMPPYPYINEINPSASAEMPDAPLVCINAPGSGDVAPYENVSFSFDEDEWLYYLGNKHLMDPDEPDTGEPFLFIFDYYYPDNWDTTIYISDTYSTDYIYKHVVITHSTFNWDEYFDD